MCRQELKYEEKGAARTNYMFCIVSKVLCHIVEPSPDDNAYIRKDYFFGFAAKTRLASTL